MNILQFLKNGSGIHIKEKNKGSFTRWCGGNVTEECIRRGKASNNPKIRKKATFAQNARHFKHKFGVKLHKAQEGDSTKNWFQKNNGTINIVGSSLVQAIPSIVSSIQSSKAARQQSEANEIADNVSEQELFNQYYKEELDNFLKNQEQATTNGEIINNSPIVTQNKAYQIAWNKAKSEMQSRKNKTKLQNAQLQQEANAGITNAITGTVGELFQTGLGSKKPIISTNTSTTSSMYNTVSSYFPQFTLSKPT